MNVDCQWCGFFPSAPSAEQDMACAPVHLKEPLGVLLPLGLLLLPLAPYTSAHTSHSLFSSLSFLFSEAFPFPSRVR